MIMIIYMVRIMQLNIVIRWIKQIQNMQNTRTRKATRPKGVENNAFARLSNLYSASCNLDLWPPDPKVDRMDHLCQFASKSVHSFSKYRVRKFGSNERTNGRTDERMNGQPEQIMLPAASWPARGVRVNTS